jgi:opacity protein-like surface antigen
MKRTLTLLTFAIISLSAYSQRFSGGILAGFNASQVDGDTYSGYNKFGFALGAFTNTQFSEKVTGELQIKFMQKGASKPVTEDDATKYTSKLNYIEIPVLIRYHQSKKISWHLGPGFGYLFKYSVEDENGSLTGSSIGFRKFELSGIAGMQYQIIEKLGVSLSFSYSLISISDFVRDPIHFRQPGQFNNLFSVLVAYKI